MSRFVITSLALGFVAFGMIGCKGSSEKVSAVPPAKTSDPIAVAPDGGGLYTPPTAATGSTVSGAGSNTTAAVPTHTIGGTGSIPAGPATPIAGGSYTVQRGDTLWSIATRHYGSGKRWRDIVGANPGLVPEQMAVGQAIRLP